MDGLADERPLFVERFSKRARQVAAAAEAVAGKAPAPLKPHAPVPAAPAAPVAAVAPAAAPNPLQAVLDLCECDHRLAPVQVELSKSDVLDPLTALEVLQPIERDVRGLTNGKYARWVHADLLSVVLTAVQRLEGQHDWPAAQEFFTRSEDISHPMLHQAVADALGRCQPVEPSAGNVRVLLKALQRCGPPPSDQQWKALCRAACRPSAAAGLGAGFVLEVLGKAEMLTRASKHTCLLVPALPCNPCLSIWWRCWTLARPPSSRR